MSLNDFSTVTIVAEGPPLTAVGFGTIGIAGYFPASVSDSYSLSFTSTTEAGTVFPTDSGVYKAVERAFQQTPRPQLVKVLRCEHAPTASVELVPLAVNGGVYNITVEVERTAAEVASAAAPIKHAVSVTADGSATVDEICDALQTALGGAFAGGDLTVTPDATTATKLTLSTTGTGRLFWVSATDPARLKVTETTADPGVATDLDTIVAHDADWYGLVTTCNARAYALAAAGWIEAQEKLYSTFTCDWAASNDGSSTTDLPAALKLLGYDRTMCAVKQDDMAASFGAAVFGERFPNDPGTGPEAGGVFTAKRLKGVAPDNWTPTQKGIIQGKGGQIFETTADVNHTLGGRAASGVPFDQTRFTDWFGTRTQEKIATIELNNGRVPNDARGRDMLEGGMRAVVALGISAGGIAAVDANGNEPTVFVPTLAQTPPEDRAARVQNGIQIGFEYTGAIEKANIQVTVVL